ncbi:DNA-binding CsgD family transcriptional regulator [Brevundimonas alba]|uniref:DNA-binding CsgD family transcriptional regulator n=1 Tax=Brevundimonas alba TaxID=74314 RepID=A0A7X6BQ63_9CAUL|nr:hypothetical protein [Brevundimonas alba]NJC42664.1 DNA-binding CsgD family transcriptional regulator [Brevundimonas alba]
MSAVDPSQSSPLDRLNKVERELLILLGRGHTAKSIATLRGLSVAAVNERFRNARRKTGLASSREIARLLTAQENRHDFIDLAPEPSFVPDLCRQDAQPSHRASSLRRWRLPMIAAGLIAVALFAQQTVTPPAASPVGRGQSLVTDLLSHQQQAPDMAALHAEAAGSPDPAWSPTTEALLSRRYEAVLTPADGVENLGVTCGATLCEVSGSTHLDVAGDRVASLMNRLQDVRDGEPTPGLESPMSSFGSSPARPGEFVFVIYWRRV